jgi:predicted transcriptional regulator of viral defense system
MFCDGTSSKMATLKQEKQVVGKLDRHGWLKTVASGECQIACLLEGDEVNVIADQTSFTATSATSA